MLFKNKSNKQLLLSEILTIKGIEFEVFIKEIKGHSVSAKIKNGSMLISIPKNIRKNEKISVSDRIKSKLIKKLEKLDQTELEALKIKNFLIKENTTCLILGKPFNITVYYSDTKRIKTKFTDSVLEISIPKYLEGINNQDIISISAKKAITKKFIPYLENFINDINKNYYNFQFNKLKIHNQNGLWGSYSRNTKNININFKLLFAPEDILKYVIIHELSHINFSNHNKKFWNTVSIACPNYKEKIIWLRKNGNKLGYT
ncbi:MAG: M48 family metallopeptidase [Candidatus Micrarchaeaceae archaeon]